MKKDRLAMAGLIALFALFFFEYANAELLVTISTDNRDFFENEVGRLDVTVFNDSNNQVENILLKIEGQEGARFVEGFEEKRLVSETIQSIRPYAKKEISVRLKLAETDETKSSIFVFYGLKEPLDKVVGTYIEKKENPLPIATSVRTESRKEGETVIVKFSITVPTGKKLTDFSAGILVPDTYTMKNPAVFLEEVEGQTIEETFEAIVPPEVSGEQKVFVAYGYFDEGVPHYFEKQVEINIQRADLTLLAIAGIVILVIVLVIYAFAGKKQDVKGTGDKEEK